MTDRKDGKTPPPIVEVVKPTPSKVWKKKYACKKNKGAHTPEILHVRSVGWHLNQFGYWERSNWMRGIEVWVTWECTGCKKRMYEFSAPQKKFDRFRDTIPLTKLR